MTAAEHTTTKPFDQLRIVFMGTPDFAVASLEALLQAKANIVGVITAPDKPAGRGMKMTQSAVKTFAQTHQLNILQPVKLKDPDFVSTLQALNADIQVVVAFRMLPEIVWSMPAMGTINVHGSLLPQYRGAAPINWAIINGEKQTGVTTFKLQHQIDTGDILLSKAIDIDVNETAGELHDRMKFIGAALLVETLQLLTTGSLQETPQPEITETLQHAPKLHSETGVINWEQPAENIHNLIRGLSPFPGATTLLHDKKLKVFKSAFQADIHTHTPGTPIIENNTIKFATPDGFVEILELQLEGKKRMLTVDFLRGYRY